MLVGFFLRVMSDWLRTEQHNMNGCLPFARKKKEEKETVGVTVLNNGKQFSKCSNEPD